MIPRTQRGRTVLIVALAMIGSWYLMVLSTSSPATRLVEPRQVEAHIHRVIGDAIFAAKEKNRPLRLEDLKEAVAVDKWFDWRVEVTGDDEHWKITATTTKQPLVHEPTWSERVFFLRRTVRREWPVVEVTSDHPWSRDLLGKPRE